MKKFTKVLAFSFLLFCISAVEAENFRVSRLHKVKLDQTKESESVKSGIFDGISVELPEDTTFISGIEINIKVPQIVASWRDSVACVFYNNVSPAPEEKTIDYAGNKISLSTIPGRLTHTIYIPLSSKFNVKESPYAKILEAEPSLFKDSVFFRFMLAMKGTSEELEQAQLELTVKPVLSDEGSFTLNVEQPEGKQDHYSVFIDDQIISSNPDKLLLKTGEHHLSVTSESYRNEVRTFIIEKAKNTSLNLILRGIEPVVKIVSPENAKVFLDGENLENPKQPVIVTPGNHTVKFILSDYEITKNLEAVNGRSYTVNLNVDATISEEE